jgi:peptidoglycan/LPS O-acetylase OafA/YrhL
MRWYVITTLLGALSVLFQYGFTRFTTTPDANWLLTYSALALWIQWQLGMVAAEIYRGGGRLPAFWYQLRWAPLFLLLGYIFKPGTIFLAFAFFIVVNACVDMEVRGRWPSTGIVSALSRVGLWSYSLYLVHFPVQTVALALSRLVMPEVGLAGFLVRAIFLTLISCVAGRVVFAIVERHFVSLPRRTGIDPIQLATQSPDQPAPLSAPVRRTQ